MHCKGGNFSKSRKNKAFLAKKFQSFALQGFENLSKMHCKGMNFIDFLLHCKGVILKADFFAAHTISRQTQCPPPHTGQDGVKNLQNLQFSLLLDKQEVQGMITRVEL